MKQDMKIINRTAEQPHPQFGSYGSRGTFTQKILKNQHSLAMLVRAYPDGTRAARSIWRPREPPPFANNNINASQLPQRKSTSFTNRVVCWTPRLRLRHHSAARSSAGWRYIRRHIRLPKATVWNHSVFLSGMTKMTVSSVPRFHPFSSSRLRCFTATTGRLWRYELVHYTIQSTCSTETSAAPSSGLNRFCKTTAHLVHSHPLNLALLTPDRTITIQQ